MFEPRNSAGMGLASNVLSLSLYLQDLFPVADPALLVAGLQLIGLPGFWIGPLALLTLLDLAWFNVEPPLVRRLEKELAFRSLLDLKNQIVLPAPVLAGERCDLRRVQLPLFQQGFEFRRERLDSERISPGAGPALCPPRRVWEPGRTSPARPPRRCRSRARRATKGVVSWCRTSWTAKQQGRGATWPRPGKAADSNDRAAASKERF